MIIWRSHQPANVQTEFGGSAPISMGEYHGAAAGFPVAAPLACLTSTKVRPFLILSHKVVGLRGG